MSLRCLRPAVLILGLLAAGLQACPEAAAQETADESRQVMGGRWREGGQPYGPRLSRGPWGAALEATYLRQFETSAGPGVRFAADRLLSRARVSYRVTPKIPLSLSFGYRYDGYRFEGAGGATFPSPPWTHVHSPRISLPLFYPISKRWFGIGVLTVRSTVEQGAALEDGVTWGGFVGASYQVSECLSIGPGFGYLTQIEDEASFFPILVVDWKIRPNLKLSTGQGLGSTQGPGLFLEWRRSSRWTFSVGGRYDRLRFRLDERGPSPGGVGEDSAWAFVAFARYTASRKLSFNASLGGNFDGRLSLEDTNGDLLMRRGYDPAVLAGIGLRLDL